MKWYCFIQMQLIGTFVHYFVLDCIVISIAAIICSPFVSMTHYRQALFSMTYFSSLVIFMEYALRDHFPLYVNLYVLGYEYCPCHYPPLHFYYCQIDKILTEEWVMAYTACGIMVCFSACTI